MARCDLSPNGKHFPGCGHAGEPKPGRRAKKLTGASSKDQAKAKEMLSTPVPKTVKGHIHDYKITKTKATSDADNLILIEYKKCQNPGCPTPEYESKTYTPKTGRAKEQGEGHDHVLGPVPIRTFTRRGKLYARYACQVKGCNYTEVK